MCQFTSHFDIMGELMVQSLENMVAHMYYLLCVIVQDFCRFVDTFCRNILQLTELQHVL